MGSSPVPISWVKLNCSNTVKDNLLLIILIFNQSRSQKINVIRNLSLLVTCRLVLMEDVPELEGDEEEENTLDSLLVENL